MQMDGFNQSKQMQHRTILLCKTAKTRKTMQKMHNEKKKRSNFECSILSVAIFIDDQPVNELNQYKIMMNIEVLRGIERRYEG